MNNYVKLVGGNRFTITKTIHDDGIFFEGIHFKENRPKDTGYGIDPDTKEAKAYCKKCNTIISFGDDLIGRTYNYCNCK